MAEKKCLTLCQVLGEHFASVDSLEKRIQKIVRNKDDDDDENADADFLEKKLSLFINPLNPSLKLVARTRRIEYAITAATKALSKQSSSISIRTIGNGLSF